MTDSLSQIKQIFSKSPIGIYVTHQGKFTFVNKTFQAISGYSEPEMLEKAPLDIVRPGFRNQVRENAVCMLKGERNDPYEYQVETRDGTVRWIMETVSSIRCEKARACLGYFMDVTETRQIKADLAISQEKYQSIFELVREGILIADYGDGRVLDANLEFQRQSGYSLEQLITKKLWELQPTEFREEVRKSFFRFKENRGGVISWNLSQNRDGKMLPVEIIAQHMVMAGQDVMICMVRDISEREAMMRALTLASEEWRKSFDALDDVVMLINPDFRIRRANMAAARLLDMDISEIIDRQCHTLFHGTDAPPAYCPQLRAKSKGVYNEAEAMEDHLNRILHFNASPIKDDLGEVTHTVEVISDVTRARRNEQESLRLSKDLAASFKGITEALSGLVESRDPYTAGHSAHVAELACKAGKELGLGTEELEGLRVCALLHDIGKAIIPAAILNKPGQLSSHEWGLIQEHPDTAYETLQRIPFPWPVAEVVRQHHERMDGSGYPRGLSNNEIHIWARIIAVADIFDAMTSHRPYRPGRPFKEAMKELTKGLDNKYDPEVVDAFMRVLRLDDNRVMVIDYDPDVLEGISAQMELEGLHPTTFTQSGPALEAFRAQAFPLVITELEMPEIDGARTTQTLKELNPETEVIMIARYSNKEGSLKALRSGASDFLEKPLNAELLRKSIQRALQRYAGRQHSL